MNRLFITGKVEKALEVTESERGIKRGTLILGVDKGTVDNANRPIIDMYQIIFWKNSLDRADSIEVGQTVGIYAHLSANNYIKDDGTVIYKAEIVADNAKIEVYA